MAMVKKVLTVFFRLALSMQAHEFTADSDTSLSRDKALPLQQITWMSGMIANYVSTLNQNVQFKSGIYACCLDTA